MPVQLYVAPAGAGKTGYVLNLARRQAEGLASQPRVIVASHLQVRACRARLAASGGALGVQVLTFDRLYGQLLAASGIVAAELSDPVQYRLIRAAVDELPLSHYAPLRDRPGFVQILRGLIDECKAAGIDPGRLGRAVAQIGGEPRLAELAQIYDVYQQKLQHNEWADRPGLGWLALDALRAGQSTASWPWLAVDGFAEFTPVQIELLRALALRTVQMTVTLTGNREESEAVYRRFQVTRRALEEALGVTAEPLPEASERRAASLAHLVRNLFRPTPAAPPPEGRPALEFIAVADRESEVRAALRWLKERILVDGIAPGQVALLARTVPPYRPFILQMAGEFGMPVRLVDGLPLSRNPAIVALLDLLRLVLPDGQSGSGPGLPRRLVTEAWRSPYFDWSMLDDGGGQGDDSAAEPDNERFARYGHWLDNTARWGRVVGGGQQWQEALDSLRSRVPSSEGDDDQDAPAGLPVGRDAVELGHRFERFVTLLAPPTEATRLRDFVAWLETLIGPDPEQGPAGFSDLAGKPTLNVVQRARVGPADLAGLDIAALCALKDVLRGLVWAEEAAEEGQPVPVDFARFFAELVGSVEGAVYHPPIRLGRLEVLVADVASARGLPLEAVALMGLAEGEFPATLVEDPFLREIDRARLNALGLPLKSAIESVEIELFYETIARPAQRLLVTRPRLADNGAEWQASPFWEEIRRLSQLEPLTQAAGRLPSPVCAASWPELLESLAGNAGHAQLRGWAHAAAADRWAAVEDGAEVLRLRGARAAASPFNGDLSAHAPEMLWRYGPDRVWSASRLESYVGCPFRFFVGDVLGLEPRSEPAEGLDAAQLGTVFHQIFAEVYTAPTVSDPSNLEQLLAALPAVAGRVLDAAPAQQGFRPTRWWAQTRVEIEEFVRKSLEALAAIQGSYVPIAFEVPFREPEELVVTVGTDSFRLHGIIDRVDRSPDGRLRIIDYKTSGPTDYPKTAFMDGKKLQLPLYALAAQDALHLGRPVDGFYWHILKAEPSKCTLSLTSNGVDDAIGPAKAAALSVIAAVREGHFEPQPPSGGCPNYCPAAPFCWHYAGRFGD